MNVSDKKEIAISFINLIVSGKINEAYEKYISTNFRHHNPFFPGDRDSLMRAMDDDFRQNPNKILDVKVAIQDGDFVSVLFHVKTDPQDPGAAVAHFYRFENEKIIELWDLAQAVSVDSPNTYGMF